MLCWGYNSHLDYTNVLVLMKLVKNLSERAIRSETHFLKEGVLHSIFGSFLLSLKFY